MRASWVAILLVVASCTPGPAPVIQKPHPFFPIDAGTHALGRATQGGELKCTACHAITNANYAQFSCLGCHEHDRDRADLAHAKVGAYRYSSESCYGCHPEGSRLGAPNPGASVRDPSQDVAVRALLPTFSATTIVGVTPSDQVIAMKMNHASGQIPAEATACASCHPNADLFNFYPGHFHTTLQGLNLPQPPACAECHGGTAPIGFVGDPDAGIYPERTPRTGEMRHDAVAWDAGAPTPTKLVTAPCATCHLAPSVASNASWKTKASFHAALDAGGRPQPGSCLDCHANSRPGVLVWPDAGLPVNMRIDHSKPDWLDDCSSCHKAEFTSWVGGRLHLPGRPAPASCLPCHEGQRPTFNDGGVRNPPFDFAPNVLNITHGAGQDCAVCHAPSLFKGGSFTHGPGTLSATTCVQCHWTQRPTAPVSGFDHALSGTGDCFGCHRGTTAFGSLGDWAGGQLYPGANLMGSTMQFVTVDQFTLKRGDGGLVTGTAKTTATLYNAMLHTSAAVPVDAGLFAGPSPGDPATCWHCHTSTPGTQVVSSYLGGKFHSSLTGYRDTPDGGVTPLGQPADRCTDCHSNMRPSGIVQKTNLQPMDHAARFTPPLVNIGGAMVDKVSLLDCSVCHASPGGTWGSGAFHSKLPAPAQAQIEDCTVCHYTLMEDSAKVDVITGASASPSYRMQHRSTQITFQKCDRCHATANAALISVAAWKPGLYHASLTTQPSACVDCHAGVTTPTKAAQSAVTYKTDGQWMNHAPAVVTGKDCAFCHVGNWTSAKLHLPGISPAACSVCHGPANGALGNNAPAGLTDSTTITSASAATGVAGVHDQISHKDVNVTGRDCNFCHTQVGIAAAGSPSAGQEWAQAQLHASFTGGAALVINGSSGRCSNCHLNVKPGATFAAQDHSGFTATSATDCSSCHSYPGTGTPAAANWRRTAAVPQSISVGGFFIAQPPAPNATTNQPGLNGLPHPALASGTACTACHTQSGGGRNAFAYDHASAPVTGCAACHEAGSDLVGTRWALNAPGAAQTTAQCGRGGGTIADRGGDTRPIGIAALPCSSTATSVTCGSANCAVNHFYPSDCGECHTRPTGVATVQTGASYAARWRFQHYFGAPAQQATCCRCHSGSSCRP